MNEEAMGSDVMVELGLNVIQNLLPDCPSNILDKCTPILRQYIARAISFQDASNRIVELIGKNEPIVRIKEIIELPMEPIPYYDSDEVDEQSGRSNRKRTRTWSNTEDMRLLAGVYHYGTDNWKAVAKFLGSGRNRAQCSQRWQRCLNPIISKKNWTDDENRRLEELVRQFGEKSWTKISGILGNRSDVQCRYHYKQICSEANQSKDGNNNSAAVSHSASFFDLNNQVTECETEEDSPISLYESRNANNKCFSQSTPLLAPFKPNNHGNSLFGACGSDPISLNNFLNHFRVSKVCIE